MDVAKAVIDKSEYVSKVKSAFRKIKPAWKPPYRTAIQIAEKMKLDISINGKSATFWKKNIDRIFDDFDNFDGDLSITLRKGKEKASLRLRWTDPQKVKEMG